MELNVQNMSCGHCVRAVTQAVQALDAQARVNVDLPAQKVHIESSLDREVMAKALTEAGYPAA